LQNTVQKYLEILVLKTSNRTPRVTLTLVIIEGLLNAFYFMCRYLLNKFGTGYAEFLVST